MNTRLFIWYLSPVARISPRKRIKRGVRGLKQDVLIFVSQRILAHVAVVEGLGTPQHGIAFRMKTAAARDSYTQNLIKSGQYDKKVILPKIKGEIAERE